MRRSNSKPFWRESKGAFYCWIEGRQRSLGKTRRAADARYRELLADREKVVARKAWTVRECFDHYLEHAATLEPNSFRNRRQSLDRFCAEAGVGRLPYSDLTVDHLEAWVKRHPDWSASMRRTCINHVMAAFNHCLKRKKIRENPVQGIAKPRWERRRAVLGDDDERKVYEASSGEFRDILTALRETGARPGELCSARVEHYAGGVITLTEHKEDASGEARTIYLSDAVAALVERRVAGRTEGPIFVNSRGNPWTPEALYCRFKRIRERLGLGEGVFPYALRHRYASEAINSGNANPALVARALGHAGLDMLMKNYFRENPEAVRRALEGLARK